MSEIVNVSFLIRGVSSVTFALKSLATISVTHCCLLRLISTLLKEMSINDISLYVGLKLYDVVLSQKN